MRNRQQGVTALGWLVLLTPFAIVLYAGIRLAPVYLNYMKVVRAVEGAGADYKGGDAQSIKTAIDRHFEIDMVEYPTTKDIKVTRQGAALVIEAAYEDEAPLFGNMSLHVTFDKKVRAGGGGTGE
ncbi:MAG TPA: DUF4845 domain-containing protein [Steroidobacteraceae bacterium]